MTDKKEHIKHSMKSTAPADCVTEIRIGNSGILFSKIQFQNHYMNESVLFRV